MTGSEGGKLNPQYRPCSLSLLTLSATGGDHPLTPRGAVILHCDPDGRISHSKDPVDYRKPRVDSHLEWLATKS